LVINHEQKQKAMKKLLLISVLILSTGFTAKNQQTTKRPISEITVPELADDTKYVSMKEWLKLNSDMESNGKWNVANKFGYMGKYQIGKLALLDLGYNEQWIDQVQSSIYYTTDTVRNIRFYHFDVALFPPAEQEKAIIRLMERHEKVYLNDVIEKFQGQTVDSVKITKAGILSASFLGFRNVKTFLESNGKINPKDGFGFSVKQRLALFQKIELKS
jgi:ribosomal protein S18